VARELGETSLMFLVHPTITPEQMVCYVEAVLSVVKQGCRSGGLPPATRVAALLGVVLDTRAQTRVNSGILTSSRLQEPSRLSGRGCGGCDS
jgi:hypothetical protein